MKQKLWWSGGELEFGLLYASDTTDESVRVGDEDRNQAKTNNGRGAT